jgi:hypothetical protein
MNGERVTPTAAQRMFHARNGMRAQVGMSDVIDMAARVMRDRARRLVPFTRRRTMPAFELLIVNDELVDLAACLSDRRGNRDATGREIERGAAGAWVGS